MFVLLLFYTALGCYFGYLRRIFFLCGKEKTSILSQKQNHENLNFLSAEAA